jgi:SAM-dependent methyltransferase
MKNKELITILSCPLCKEDLEYRDEDLLCKSRKTIFPISENIYFLLPEEQKKPENSMDYLEHYMIDGEIFDYYEERECKATAHDERRLREYILSLVPKNCDYVLDVGSGNSWVAGSLYNKCKKVVSMDLSLINLQKGRSKYPFVNHYSILGDANNPPFKQDSFDCIIASEVIEHITEPQIFISSLIKLLKPGGKIIISTPYKEKIQMSLCIHCNKPTPRNAHLHSFDEKKLKNYFINQSNELLKSYIFGNKALTMLRTHIILKYFPFYLWKITDATINLIINKKSHIIIVYKKTN